MRLPHGFTEKLIASCKAVLPGIKMDVFLYGSRMDDRLSGGDIDLIVLVGAEDVEKARLAKFALLASLKSAYDMRIDLSFLSAEEKQKDPFYGPLEMALLFSI